jgi:hypothetical protein
MGNGILSEKQSDNLEKLRELRHKTLVSNDYDTVVIELANYCADLRFPCQFCSKVFKSRGSLAGHVRCLHAKRV